MALNTGNIQNPSAGRWRREITLFNRPRHSGPYRVGQYGRFSFGLVNESSRGRGEGFSMKIKNKTDLAEALKNGPYAWPGGYPLFFITNDGAALSFDTVKAEIENVQHSIETDSNDGWRVVAIDVNWEEPNLICDHSGQRIESAYCTD